MLTPASTGWNVTRLRRARRNSCCAAVRRCVPVIVQHRERDGHLAEQSPYPDCAVVAMKHKPVPLLVIYILILQFERASVNLRRHY